MARLRILRGGLEWTCRACRDGLHIDCDPVNEWCECDCGLIGYLTPRQAAWYNRRSGPSQGP